MARDKWQFDFREDQTQFIVAALKFVQQRCDTQVDDSVLYPLRTFTALRTKECATEILDYIQDITT